MKDIYELLSDVDIDEDEIDTMEVSDIEKAKVKKHLKISIKKNNGWKKKGLIAAVLGCVVIGSVGLVGITNPAYAAEIPIVGDIFRFLDNGRTGVYDKYKENANEINVTRESNGVAITIKDAIYDGKTLSYTYEIKSDKDLGESPMICGGLKIKGYKGGMTGGAEVRKIDENTYIGKDDYSIDEDKDEVICQLNIREIIPTGQNDSNIEIKGQWDFDFDLKAIPGNKQLINKGTEKDGVKANIDSITKTSMSFIINYSQVVPDELRKKWFDMSLEIEVKDDLGNNYKGQGNGGHGNDNDNTMYWSKTFGKLDEKATKLIISPKMHLSNTGGGVSIDENGKETEIKHTIDADHPARGEIKFDDIVINLEK
ncbi:DUF4179 domain-containing protein [Clostridium sp. C2-6-12]|uniref:DUF4179 domain-containing protein n=1 Tax=Clostridium sp. C2-6-12 TaxID=2698832 RepID=UPI001369F806|nr:DUF4179 domain-containing protein [Clostridium sp. C2-6-12]